MAQIVIETTPDEQAKVLEVLRGHPDEVLAMSAIAKEAGINQNRVRYIIIDLEEAGKIKRIPAKAFNAHYIRYKYEVLA